MWCLKHHIWDKTVLWGTVFIKQTTDRMQYFTILQYKLHSFKIQDDRSTPGLLAKPLKKFQSHLYGQLVLTFAVRVFEWTLIELRFYIIKNLLCLFFIQWFYQCVIFKSVWYAWHFEYFCKRCSLNDWKQTAQRLRLCFKPASRCLTLFQDELEARKSLKAFFYSQNYM